MSVLSPTVCVYGAGAVGCYLGGLLASQEVPVTLIGRPAVVTAVRQSGLVVQEPGRLLTSTPEAVTDAAELRSFDLVILAVRAFDVGAAIPDLRGLLGEHGLLLAMQNGVGTEETLANALGRSRMLAGTVTTSVGMVEPGVVHQKGRHGGIALATMTGDPVPAWVAALFALTGLPVQLIADYHSLRWSKLLLNMLGAPVSAILDTTPAVIVADPALFALEQRAFKEALRVMRRRGIEPVSLPAYPVPMLARAMRLPRPIAQRLVGPRLAAARGNSFPTMRADLARGRSEVSWLNGAVERTAQQMGESAPVNATLARIVREIAAYPERRAHYVGQSERLLERIP